MADKTATGAAHDVIESSAVSTAGTTTATTVKILWDDADSKLTIMDAFEKARRAFIRYMLTGN